MLFNENVNPAFPSDRVIRAGAGLPAVRQGFQGSVLESFSPGCRLYEPETEREVT